MKKIIEIYQTRDWYSAFSCKHYILKYYMKDKIEEYTLYVNHIGFGINIKKINA